MWGLTTKHQYYLYRGVTDMRRSFDALSGMVRSEFKSDPLNGSVYIFINRPRNQIKLLIWDASGFLLYHKRLEKGTFERFVKEESGVATISLVELTMLLEGISLKNMCGRERYTRPSVIPNG